MCMLSFEWLIKWSAFKFTFSTESEYHVCIPCDEPLRIRIDTRDVSDILQWEKWLYVDWCQLQQQCCQRYQFHQRNPFGAGKGEMKALHLPSGASVPHKPIHCPFQRRTRRHQTPARNITPRHVLSGIHRHTFTSASLVVALGHQRPTCWLDYDYIVTVKTRCYKWKTACHQKP